MHIVPRIGEVKLARLTKPGVHAFRDALLDAGMNPVTARKVLGSLKAILSEAHGRGHVAQNVAAKVRIELSHRGRGPLQVGVDIPTPADIGRLLGAVDDRLRPVLVTAAFAGLRASELRGLRWGDVDLAGATVTVRQRADHYNLIGMPKSRAGTRVIPVGPMVESALRTWKLKCPPNAGDLVFPGSSGGVADYKSIGRPLATLMVEAGLVDDAGEPKYGWHSMRHFYASWCINRHRDGGLELPAEVVQARLGHASIVMTFDTYGHPFPSTDAELAAAERKLLALAGSSGTKAHPGMTHQPAFLGG